MIELFVFLLTTWVGLGVAYLILALLSWPIFLIVTNACEFILGKDASTIPAFVICLAVMMAAVILLPAALFN